jgi:acyl transferase domain-containing protein/phosphopantetheinyl transferase
VTEPHHDIAIVGIACLFPGADTPARFWQNIVNRVDCVTNPPPGWRADHYLDPSAASEPIYTAKGGYLGDLARFVPGAHGVMPSAIDGAEPDQFVALRCAAEALADAGAINRERTGVILGRGLYHNRGTYTWVYHGVVVDQVIDLLRQLEPRRGEDELATIRAELKRNLPPFSAETVPGLAHCVMAGRIANRLDLKGPAYTLDAACASALIAVDHAVRELRASRCDAVLAGGVQVSTPVVLHQLFCRIDGLSRAGRIAPFSADANGTLLGEGCGILVLKRRADAERDGDRIYALVKEIGVSSDGRGAGLLAPRTEGQQLAIRRAYEQAGVSPSSVGLVEAHGTGMPLGDRTEIESLAACFGTRENGGPAVALGSVKSMIGHLIPASGAASLIKSALALYHRVLPPTLNADTPSPRLGLERTPFYLSSQVRPWVHGEPDTPRRAGVNAFGFGGVNAHALLEEHAITDEAALGRGEVEWPAELVVLSAADRAGLREQATALARWLDGAAGVRLLDVAASCAAAPAGDCRLAIVAADLDDLRAKLARAAKLLGGASDRIQDRGGLFWYAEPLARGGRVAFVLPGEGAQYPNMLAELCRHFPEARREFDRTDAAFRRLGAGRPLSRLLFPLPGAEQEAEAELLGMEGAVAAVTSAQRALLAVLASVGVRADAVVGHSSGEFGALLAAGAFVPADEGALLASIAEGAAVAADIARPGLVPPAVLLAGGGGDPEAVREVLASSGGRLAVALDNCPHQMVLAGEETAAAAALDGLRGRGGVWERLPWGRPYHTAAFAAALPPLEAYYRRLGLGAPRTELWSCATADRFPGEPESVLRLALRQWCAPVRFRETVQAMYAAGVRLFVEVGPRGNLSAFVSDTLGKQAHAAVPLDVPRRGGVEQLCRALGQLAAHGVDVDLPALYRRRGPRLLDLGAAPPAPSVSAPPLNQALPELRLRPEVAASLRAEKDVGQVCNLPSRTAGYKPAPRPEPSTPSAAAPTVAAVRPAADPRARAFAEMQETMRVFLQAHEQAVRAQAAAAPGRRAAAAVAVRAEPVPHTVNRLAHVPVVHPRAQPAAVAPRPAAAAPLPFIENVLVHEPGRLVVECELDVARHPFLSDHTFFGRDLSARAPGLVGLPVMPLAMTLEIMAEAAVTLRPGLAIAAVRDVQTLRWLAFEGLSRRVRAEAAAGDGDDVRVTVFEANREGMAARIAEATFELSPREPGLGAPVLPDENLPPFPWRQEEVYGRILFHGPAFQGVERMDACEPHATRATVREPDPGRLLPGGERLVLPVVLIDVAGQVSGITVRHQWNERDIYLTFPNRVERLEFAARRERGVPLRSVARVSREGNHVLSDVEMTDPDGRVVFRATGRAEELARLPADLYAYWPAPDRARLTRDVSAAFADVPGAADCTVCEAGAVADKVLVGRLWSQALARMILGPEERRRFEGLKLGPLPAASWLLGRVAAKEAVRARTGAAAPLADLPLSADEHGRPVTDLAGAAPLVSVAHKGLAAVAVAADPRDWEGVGIDLEPAGAMDAGVKAEAFTAGEREILEAAARETGEAADSWYMAAWCAKEAVGKALGRGLPGGPRDLEVLRAEPATGRIDLALRGALAAAFPRRVPVAAYRRALGGHVAALCLLPRVS